MIKKWTISWAALFSAVSAWDWPRGYSWRTKSWGTKRRRKVLMESQNYKRVMQLSRKPQVKVRQLMIVKLRGKELRWLKFLLMLQSQTTRQRQLMKMVRLVLWRVSRISFATDACSWFVRTASSSYIEMKDQVGQPLVRCMSMSKSMTLWLASNKLFGSSIQSCKEALRSLHFFSQS